MSNSIQPHGPLTATQRMHQTQFTRTGVLDLTSRKPYRKQAQKAEAKKRAWQDDRGIWHTDVPVSFHPEIKS